MSIQGKVWAVDRGLEALGEGWAILKAMDWMASPRKESPGLSRGCQTWEGTRGMRKVPREPGGKTGGPASWTTGKDASPEGRHACLHPMPVRSGEVIGS